MVCSVSRCLSFLFVNILLGSAKRCVRLVLGPSLSFRDASVGALMMGRIRRFVHTDIHIDRYRL